MAVLAVGGSLSRCAQRSGPKAETLVACFCVMNKSCNGKGKNGSCLRLKAFAECLCEKKRDGIDKRHLDSKHQRSGLETQAEDILVRHKTTVTSDEP